VCLSERHGARLIPVSSFFLFDEICCLRFTILFSVWSLLVDLASSCRAFVFMRSRNKCSVRSCLKPLLRTTLSHQDMICSVVRVLSWTAETLFWHSEIDRRIRCLRWLRSFSLLDTKNFGIRGYFGQDLVIIPWRCRDATLRISRFSSNRSDDIP
jgi:hypothetical protein